MTTSLDRDCFHRFMEHSAHVDRGDRYSPALRIQINTGVGGASTPLAAFDAALCAIGVGNLNVLQLSSVIPPGSTMRHADQVTTLTRANFSSNSSNSSAMAQD